jgi:hypothetical protein
LRDEQQTLSAVPFLFDDQKLPRDQALDQIARDQTLTPAQRALALEFAQSWRVAE